MNFNKEQKQTLCHKLADYCSDELSVELGQFDAEFLFDFVCEKLGPHFYNQGVYDSQAVLSAKTDELSDAILNIEKPV